MFVCVCVHTCACLWPSGHYYVCTHFKGSCKILISNGTGNIFIIIYCLSFPHEKGVNAQDDKVLRKKPIFPGFGSKGLPFQRPIKEAMEGGQGIVNTEPSKCHWGWPSLATTTSSLTHGSRTVRSQGKQISGRQVTSRSVVKVFQLLVHQATFSRYRTLHLFHSHWNLQV